MEDTLDGEMGRCKCMLSGICLSLFIFEFPLTGMKRRRVSWLLGNERASLRVGACVTGDG